jgi:glycosyltransferase involved in cell wall biosynthesis
MRVAICTDQYLPLISGLVDSVDTLARELRAMGHEVRIYAPVLPGSVPDKNIFHFPSWTLPGSGSGIVLSFPFGAIKNMREFKPDVIHTHLFGIAGLLALVASRRLKVPLVGTDHTSPADYLHYFYLNFQPFIFLARSYASWFYSRCALVTAPSQHVLDELYEYGMHHTPMQVISNPIPFDLFRPLEHKAARKEKYGVRKNAVLLFGRIAQEKNLDTALAVFKKLRETLDAQLVVVGDGPYRKELEENVRAQKLEASVTFLGVLRGDALVEALNTTEALLVTSTSEIQPMTILQAMATGLPVVGARAGGVPSVIIDGDTGYLVEPSAIDAYAKKLELLLTDDLLRENFGRAARASISSYSPREIAQKFVEVYKFTQ